jgi:hypothetical protein
MPFNNRKPVVFFIEPQAAIRVRVVAEIGDACWGACESFFAGQVPLREDAFEVVSNANSTGDASGMNPPLHGVTLRRGTRRFIRNFSRLLRRHQFCIYLAQAFQLSVQCLALRS